VGNNKQTFERWTQLPNAKSPDAQILAERQFEEEHRNSGEEESHEVRHEKRSCTPRHTTPQIYTIYYY